MCEMGTTKQIAVNQAHKIAQEYCEEVLIIHDLEYKENYGDKSAYYPVRESFAGEWINDSDIEIVKSVYPR